jgi:single-strand DNA-binding protein
MINRVILVGHLTRDAESTSGPSTTLTRMRLATNAVWRDAEGNRQESAEFHTVVAFGKLGEICASYCLKGRCVYIDGRLRTREYDSADGLRRHSTEVVAETMKLLDRPHNGDDSVNTVEPPSDAEHEGALVAVEGGARNGARAPRGHTPVR